jgi:hypothetical protein
MSAARDDEAPDEGEAGGSGAEQAAFAAERLADEVEELRRGRRYV